MLRRSPPRHPQSPIQDDRPAGRAGTRANRSDGPRPDLRQHAKDGRGRDGRNRHARPEQSAGSSRNQRGRNRSRRSGAPADVPRALPELIAPRGEHTRRARATVAGAPAGHSAGPLTVIAWGFMVVCLVLSPPAAGAGTEQPDPVESDPARAWLLAAPPGHRQPRSRPAVASALRRPAADPDKRRRALFWQPSVGVAIGPSAGYKMLHRNRSDAIDGRAAVVASRWCFWD